MKNVERCRDIRVSRDITVYKCFRRFTSRQLRAFDVFDVSSDIINIYYRSMMCLRHILLPSK